MQMAKVLWNSFSKAPRTFLLPFVFCYYNFKNIDDFRIVLDLQENYEDSIESSTSTSPYYSYLILVGWLCHKQWTKLDTLLLTKV